MGYSVLQYLRGTVALGLVYGPARIDHGPDGAFRVKGAGHLLELHCDASFGPDSSRSQTGPVAISAMLLLLGCPCDEARQRCQAQKQSLTAAWRVLSWVRVFRRFFRSCLVLE